MRSIKLFMSIILIAFLAGCSLPGSTAPTVSVEDVEKALVAIRTEVALTVAAEIANAATSTPLPQVVTAAPSETAISTELVLPTSTALPTSTPLPTSTAVVLPTAIPATLTATATQGPKPSITIIGVEKNKVISVQADIFPANQVFKIRVGPFETFFQDYVEVGTINSGQGGSFKFTVQLPSEVKDVERITVRLDSAAKEYAYNYFKNENSGTIPTVATPVTATPITATPSTATPATATPSTANICEVSVSPALSSVMKPGEDFDAVWTVKNISGKTWESGNIDYKYIRGTELQKYEKIYDLTEVVKTGETVKIRVDMLAPKTAGTYTTTWALVTGNTTLCNLPVTIIVK